MLDFRRLLDAGWSELFADEKLTGAAGCRRRLEQKDGPQGHDLGYERGYLAAVRKLAGLPEDQLKRGHNG